MVTLGYLFSAYLSAADMVSYEPGPTNAPVRMDTADGSMVLSAKVWLGFPIFYLYEYFAGPGLIFYAIFVRNILSYFPFF